MNKEDLEKTLKAFQEPFSDGPYHKDLYEPCPAKWYNHKEEEFKIIIFDNNEVYQVGTESNTIGVELKNYDSLKIRFESFTGVHI